MPDGWMDADANDLNPCIVKYKAEDHDSFQPYVHNLKSHVTYHLNCASHCNSC